MASRGERGIAAPAEPRSLARIADASAGLIGVQIVWGLQNVSTSRIFQTLGASIADLPILWIAAPVTGLMVQPVVGWLSDHTRTRFGRRRPYLALGGVLTALAMVAMAVATSLAAAVIALWLLTASVNIAMQPLRALLADILPAEHRARGYAIQVVFIGAGAVFASCLPWLLAQVTPHASSSAGGLPPSVRLSFWIGAAGLLASVGWTLVRTREPEVAAASPVLIEDREVRSGSPAAAAAWMAAGIAVALVAGMGGLRREIYLVAVIAAAYGALQAELVRRRRRGRPITGPLQIIADIIAMPPAMRRLGVTQFFTWFGLFALWIYAVPAIASRYFGTEDAASAAYNASADWVGVLFALHDAVATVAALLLPRLVARIGLGASHAACLAMGAAGLVGMISAPGPYWLLLPSICIGCAWASILSAPYAIVANSVPGEKLGVYMGIHNIFLVLPQLAAASTLGIVVERLLDGRATVMLPLAAIAFLVAAALAATPSR